MKCCAFCQKGTSMGRRISHAHNVTNRPVEANLQRVRATIDGISRRVWACTNCIKSGRVVKPAVRTWKPEEATT